MNRRYFDFEGGLPRFNAWPTASFQSPSILSVSGFGPRFFFDFGFFSVIVRSRFDSFPVRSAESNPQSPASEIESRSIAFTVFATTAPRVC